MRVEIWRMQVKFYRLQIGLQRDQSKCPRSRCERG